MAEAIHVDGLKEFNRALKAMDSELPKALRVALNDVADVVISKAKVGIPRRSGKAAASVKARSTRTAVRVVAGGSRAEYYPWLDFGGRVGRKNSIIRYFLKDGRYLYPAYFKMRDSGEIQHKLVEVLTGVAKQAGLVVE